MFDDDLRRASGLELDLGVDLGRMNKGDTKDKFKETIESSKTKKRQTQEKLEVRDLYVKDLGLIMKEASQLDRLAYLRSVRLRGN